MKHFILAILLVLIASCSHHGCKGKKQGCHGKHVAQVDKNKDGKISKDEFIAFKTSKFQEKDKNGDGFITKDERKSCGLSSTCKINKRSCKGKKQGCHSKHVAQVDKNKDGKISKDEFLAFKTSKFQEKDKNGDGFITKDERKCCGSSGTCKIK